jgi:hypothetical protein
MVKVTRCRGILRLVLNNGVDMRSLAVILIFLVSPVVLATPSHPEGPEPIPLPPTGPSVFPETVSSEGIFQPISMIQWGLDLNGLDKLSDGDSGTVPDWDVSIIRARLGLGSERENVSLRVVGEFKRDRETSVWEAESGDTLELPDEVSGWRYQLRDAFMELGDRGGFRVGLASSGIGLTEGGAIGAQGHNYPTLGVWSGLFEDRFYSAMGRTKILGANAAVVGGRGQSGKAMAASSVQLEAGPVAAGVAGGLYDGSALVSGWGSAGIGATTLQVEVLYVGDIAWSAGASYLRPLEGEVFSGFKLLSQTRYKGGNGGQGAGLEATGGFVLIHRVDEDLDLTSGLSWSAFFPGSTSDSISHSAVVDFQLFY